MKEKAIDYFNFGNVPGITFAPDLNAHQCCVMLMVQYGGEESSLNWIESMKETSDLFLEGGLV